MKIYMIKTKTICYITDRDLNDNGYYNSNNSDIHRLYFDGEKARQSFHKNWYIINKYPNVIQKSVSKYGNKRYEIIDENMVCDKLPNVIQCEDMINENIRELYVFKQDRMQDEFKEVDCEIEVIMELDELQMPKEIKYDAIGSGSYNDKPYTITNSSVKHQMLDKIIFPDVMLHHRPCSLSSKQMYDITRQYIKDNIDLSVAKITSDFDFCFTVKKIIPLIEPETITYSNIFARTKKERNKIHYKTKKYNETEIFSMTHDQRNYDGYTAIEPMFANNENELKEKVDTWLEGLIEIINKDLKMCSHCNGTGYREEVSKIDINKDR